MDSEMSGVSVETVSHDCAEVTTVKITTADGAKKMGRPIGDYITLEKARLRACDGKGRKTVAGLAAELISRLITVDCAAHVLVVGLGNPAVESDSLGARVARKIIVTNCYADELPGSGLRPVSAFVPDVRGNNGLPTREIVKAVCDAAKPALVMCVDALAARALSRLYGTIQISNTGISPGQGINPGANSGAIDADYLGVPVISIGVPTVVDAMTLIGDAVSLAAPDSVGGDYLSELLSAKGADGNSGAAAIERRLKDELSLSFFTPRESGDITAFLVDVIADAVNIALHGADSADGLF